MFHSTFVPYVLKAFRTSIVLLVAAIALPGAAVAVVGTPTATCTRPCEVCIVRSVPDNRCVQCGVDLACGLADGGLVSEMTQMLNAHNGKRDLHRVPELTWSADLARGAQQWANLCSNTHSQANGAYGENLAFITGNSLGATEVFQNIWYCEIQWYYFNNPKIVGGFKRNCDPPVNQHFTQVVWRDTRQIGCGLSPCTIDGVSGTYWVCRYSPPGNWDADKPGVLDANVLPPGGVRPAPLPSGSITPQSTQPSGQPSRGEWSSFATDGKGHWGYGSHWVTVDVASDFAVEGCGGAGIGCKVFWTTTDQCVSYAEARGTDFWYYAAGGGADQQQAIQNAIRFCQSGNAPANTCKSVVAECR